MKELSKQELMEVEGGLFFEILFVVLMVACAILACENSE